jgi:hypothetical protein
MHQALPAGAYYRTVNEVLLQANTRKEAIGWL